MPGNVGPAVGIARWTAEYLHNRNLMTRAYVSIEERADRIVAEAKDGSRHMFFVVPDLGMAAEALREATGSPKPAIITANTRKNVEALAAAWKSFVAVPRLSIYFVSPGAAGEKRWIIHPSTHDRIADAASLKRGLLALYEGVEPYR
ncbi:hypothetical protein JXB02_03310 [Candidatus Woesearchaeota archaeon]|nr:hypothetical protein [Candidatus Woesearchaeota archaeon]